MAYTYIIQPVKESQAYATSAQLAGYLNVDPTDFANANAGRAWADGIEWIVPYGEGKNFDPGQTGEDAFAFAPDLAVEDIGGSIWNRAVEWGKLWSANAAPDVGRPTPRPPKFNHWSLWLHWANREFRNWQYAHGKTVGTVTTGSKADHSPPLRRPFPKPVVHVSHPTGPVYAPPICLPNPVSKPPKTVADLNKYVADVVMATLKLEAAIARFNEARGDAADLLAAAYVAKGLTQLYREENVWHRGMGGFDALADAGKAVYDALEAKLGGEDIDTAAAALLKEIGELGKQLSTLTLKGSVAPLANYVGDTCIGAREKADRIDEVKLLMVRAAQATSFTPSFRDLDSALEKDIVGDPSKPLLFLATVAGGAVGVVPGPDAFVLALLGVKGSIAVAAAKGPAFLRQSVLAFIAPKLKLPADKQALFDEHVKGLEQASLPADEAALATHRGALEGILKDHFEAHVAMHDKAWLTFGIGLLNLYQVAVLWEDKDKSTTTLGAASWVAGVAVPGMAAAGAATMLAGKLAGKIGAIGRLRTTTPKFALVLDGIQKVTASSALSRVVSGLTGAATLVSGGIQLFQGLEAGDTHLIIVGALNTGSGLLILIGSAFKRAAGAARFGVLLGFVTLVADFAVSSHDRGRTASVLFGIADALQNKKMRHSDRSEPLSKLLGLTQHADTLKSRLDGLESWLFDLEPQPPRPKDKAHPYTEDEWETAKKALVKKLAELPLADEAAAKEAEAGKFVIARGNSQMVWI